MPTLSIIVPTLNEASEIKNALAALQELRRSGTEIVVADGGSDDGTPALARELADRVVASPRGRAAQMNAGAAAARGDIFLFLHADTRLPDRADRLVTEALRGATSCWGRFDVTLIGRSRLLPLVAAMMNWRSRLTGICTGDQSLFVTRQAFEAVGGFPELPLMEDIAMSKRLKRLSRPIPLRARVRTSGRRWDRDGPFRTALLMWGLRLAYFFGADPALLARLYGYRSVP